ncbi:N2227-domain-containing protein [Auriscalpium vulgare]|uniref:N2227-domain-containing protein n=1 Tax=Auriscalpium vulgare TaxID=40419 RepID=A0ACB8RZV1_9AGAM|nr:N2227-domain-containing protein [Auriscalpium vulgare]
MAPVEPDDVEEERRHFQDVITAFKHYAAYTLAGNHRRRQDLFTLPLEDRALLDQLGYKQKLFDADQAILANADFLNQIVANQDIFEKDADLVDDQKGHEDPHPGLSESHAHDHSHGEASHRHSHSHSHAPLHRHALNPIIQQEKRNQYKPSDYDMDKVRSTLKQFVRDWSVEGRDEREASYKPMKEALLGHFSDIPFEERHNFRVLVPGAGLGRLAYDVAKLGFSCQGNEFSHYMLLASFFILNRTNDIDQHTIYPYVHSFSNLPNRSAMLQAVTIPDVLPSDLPTGSDFSLVAGDFEEIYGAEDESDPKEPSAGQWDAILTCFFIDTAKNIVNYLRIIHKILTPGGIWINLGPLLWHFENNTSNDPSIELDLEEIKELVRQIGFEITSERNVDTTYVNNPNGMLGYVYHAAFWTATKKL